MKVKKHSFSHTNGEFHHKHSLGQNFIEDEALLDQLAVLSLVDENDSVLEIGPGLGALTKPLAKRAKKIVSLEIDKTLLPILAVILEKYDNASVVQGDVMKTDLGSFVTKHFGEDCSLRVAANLPYYITNDVLMKFLFELPQAKSIAVMIQKEVGDKLLSAPGDDGYGPLAVLCQYYCEVNRALDVPAACFTPPPKVDSSFMLLIRREPLRPARDEKLFVKLVKGAFAMRRKTLANNLVSCFSMPREKALLCLENAQLDERARAEELTVGQFSLLSDAIAEQFK